MLTGEPSQNGSNYTLAPLAEVTRANKLESIHAGTIAVASADGSLIAHAGDPETFAFFRSSAKPFQAIPVVESGAADAFGLTSGELALCCASHYAERSHQLQVADMLGKLGLSPDCLQCGIPLPSDTAEFARVVTGAVQPSPLQCDCSGKHSGMLAVCVHQGYSLDNYLDSQHPLQQQILSIMSTVLRKPVESIAIGRDGCSLPTFGSSIASFAVAYAALADPERGCPQHAIALNRLRQAMIERPENVSGQGTLVTDLMAHGGGRIVAKTGAEGLICLGVPEASIGIAIRIADGSFRAHPELVLSVLAQLGLMDEQYFQTIRTLHPAEVRNHNGWHVGDIRPIFTLSRTGTLLAQ